MKGYRSPPTGKVTFFVDGVALEPTVELDKRGQACLPADRLKAGEHSFHAHYTSDDEEGGYRSSTSPYLRYQVERAPKVKGDPESPPIDPGKGRRRWLVLTLILLLLVLLMGLLLT